jgi:CrcB protein
MNLIYVFIGGGVGAALRWMLSSYLQTSSPFPLGTFAVNMIGCLLIGILSVFIIQNSNKWELLLMVGFLGGFTTFSSFGFDLFKLLKTSNYNMLLTYVLASNVLGLILVIVGNKLTSLVVN